MSDTESLETRADATAAGGEARYWQIQLELSEREHKDWIKDGEAVVCRYRGEKDKATKSNSKRFAILYSNTETLKSAIYARTAKPDVRRRFSDQDPIGRAVAEIIERALIHCADDYDADEDSDSAIESAIEDYLLPGRGVVRVDYAAETTQDEQGREIIANQRLSERYVFWKDFRHEPTTKWSRVTWIAFRHKMSRSALIDNFGEELGSKCPLNWSPDINDKKAVDAFKRAEVWEIWDKETKTRVWVVNGFAELLRKDPDPYGLRRFFPIAKPLFAVTTNDKLIPEPEFHIYKDQADGLDEIENRIDRLTRALKRRGVYDATVSELKRLAKAADNEFIPVKNYAELAAKGGLEKAFQAEDIQILAKVLDGLHQQRDLRIQTIYEVTGISDILRGATDPNETLGAQQLKAQFGGARLKKRQDRVQKWIRDTLRIKAEIIAEHFEPQKLEQVTGVPIVSIPQPPMTGDQQKDMAAQKQYAEAQQRGQQIMQILRSDKLRSYRVDIETDSTVFEDAQAEKEARVELITSMTGYLEKAIPAGQMMPPLMPLLFEVLSFGLRGFKAGRSLEDIVEQTKTAMQQQAQQPKPPDPAVVAEQQKAQLEKERFEQEKVENAERMAMEREKHQQEMAQGAQKFQQELAMMSAKGDEQIKMMREKAKAKPAPASNGKGGAPAPAPVPDNSDVVEALEQNGAMMAQALTMLAQAINQMSQSASAPKRVVRDDQGMIVGAETVTMQ